MKYDITVDLKPNEIALLRSGENELLGLIKNTSNHQIVKHVPVAQSSNIKTSQVLIGVGIGLVVSAAAAATIFLLRKKKVKNHVNLEKKLSMEYNNSMVNYVQRVTNGTLSIKDIKKFADVFDAILKDYQAGDLKINLSEEEISVLYGIVFKFTKALFEKNELLLDGKYPQLEDLNSKNKESNMVLIRDLLFVQEEIYSKNDGNFRRFH